MELRACADAGCHRSTPFVCVACDLPMCLSHLLPICLSEEDTRMLCTACMRLMAAQLTPVDEETLGPLHG